MAQQDSTWSSPCLFGLALSDHRMQPAAAEDSLVLQRRILKKWQELHEECERGWPHHQTK